MARNITWKNVAAPNLNGSVAGVTAAGRLFGEAANGFSDHINKNIQMDRQKEFADMQMAGMEQNQALAALKLQEAQNNFEKYGSTVAPRATRGSTGSTAKAKTAWTTALSGAAAPVEDINVPPVATAVAAPVEITGQSPIQPGPTRAKAERLDTPAVPAELQPRAEEVISSSGSQEPLTFGSNSVLPDPLAEAANAYTVRAAEERQKAELDATAEAAAKEEAAYRENNMLFGQYEIQRFGDPSQVNQIPLGGGMGQFGNGSGGFGPQNLPVGTNNLVNLPTGITPGMLGGDASAKAYAEFVDKAIMGQDKLTATAGQGIENYVAGLESIDSEVAANSTLRQERERVWKSQAGPAYRSVVDDMAQAGYKKKAILDEIKRMDFGNAERDLFAAQIDAAEEDLMFEPGTVAGLTMGQEIGLGQQAIASEMNELRLDGNAPLALAYNAAMEVIGAAGTASADQILEQAVKSKVTKPGEDGVALTADGERGNWRDSTGEVFTAFKALEKKYGDPSKDIYVPPTVIAAMMTRYVESANYRFMPNETLQVDVSELESVLSNIGNEENRRALGEQGFAAASRIEELNGYGNQLNDLYQELSGFLGADNTKESSRVRREIAELTQRINPKIGENTVQAASDVASGLVQTGRNMFAPFFNSTPGGATPAEPASGAGPVLGGGLNPVGQLPRDEVRIPTVLRRRGASVNDGRVKQGNLFEDQTNTTLTNGFDQAVGTAARLSESFGSMGGVTQTTSPEQTQTFVGIRDYLTSNRSIPQESKSMVLRAAEELMSTQNPEIRNELTAGIVAELRRSGVRSEEIDMLLARLQSRF